MKKECGVVFDLDGTLLNTLEDIADAMNYALESLGQPPWELDAYRYMVGNGARILAERAVRSRRDLAERALAAYQAEYETHSQVKTCPYEGIPELLRELNRREIPVFVLTNKPHADAQRIVHYYFPEISFAGIQGQVPELPVKPDPAGALAIAGSLNLPPERFFYLGDTSVDMDCARRAGMRSVGVLWGFRTRSELKGSGASALIDRPEELLKLLED